MASVLGQPHQNSDKVAILSAEGNILEDPITSDIPKQTEKGKIDFHALRVVCVSIVLESRASAKETQMLAHPSKAKLTMNVYARTGESE